MRYIPNAPEERAEMLREIGCPTVEHLFRPIPERFRLREPLRLPPARSEAEVLAFSRELAARNAAATEYALFLGAGAYHHFIPSVVEALISRAEFTTVYTPYQPEIAQGTLQALFEYQTLICQLTGMEVANASLYDGSTALAEAVLMAERVTRRREILLADSVHPEYREVIRTYTRALGVNIRRLEYDPETGGIAQRGLAPSAETAALVVQSPNFFGVIEDIEALAERAHEVGALLIVVITEPISLGLIRPPGELGADIVVGEGQSFGIPLSFGGPSLGIFATRERFVRQMPGRIVGQAFDSQGRRGFVMTLATREQYIRREKATSNICTSQELCAIMAAIYLSTMGPRGLREVAEQNAQKAAYLAREISRQSGFRLRFSGSHFNEFVVQSERPVELVLDRLRERKILGGLPLGPYYPELRDCFLVCVTEMITRSMMETYLHVLDEL
ncbi:MAG: aminomethyl-transferring glycine dehydrogenase subunit GcvPA [Blastocatellia bacterium]|nr:aminomethyl-transferring glycine dehydrogenase subunit GcvPA [Blastocatellia bacterium]MCS7156534.1 aminomethyl-transferring glycine dehydrogenase subunit GcvPA [Blastocatellia bacterium]MCX7751725.1 aminomethyl-transferring glycine dehydrogenase subunit GcvPA [Blastocatellia bacterium]MDW8168826.1 aminomethyl-transferring glycine dehydrogenase subunit GcvPA [Acidobacteriota bacterium]MDW8257460.1 aminomethyl-transferring glycine dehydrogenase subunit GcvPA [Acidobacteriota bacterium]